MRCLVVPKKRGKFIHAFLLSKNKKFNNGKTVTIYKTESQLFPKNSEVKRQKHSKILHGEQKLLKKRVYILEKPYE
jgi:hypothetical protein